MTSLIHIAASSMQDSHGLWALCFALGSGCFLTVFSRRLHLPTIVLLLIGGFTLGPMGIGVIDPETLGEFLPIIVSLAVGLILFEGALTLDLKEFQQTSTVIKRLLTVGVLITWLGSAFTAYLVFETTPSFALLMGSLIIVTGPTVILPLLRRIRVQQNLGRILHWEGVLIDTIGVFIAILCFEWVVEGGGAVALPNFIIRIISGIIIGVIGGSIIYWMMRKNWVPNNIVNAFALASAVLIFGATELIKPEAGLLSVTIAGLIVGIKKPRQLREIKAFKAEIVDLLIGMLFILLVARLEIEQFITFFEMGGGWVLFSVILLIRPISVVVSSWGTSLNIREKAFLSWVAPRGVVAASMASLFALSLSSQETPAGDPALLESFVYSVICATVLIQGLSAGLFAKFLGLQRPAPNDWIIIGAHHFGRELARKLLREDEQNVILLDTNTRNITLAQKEGIPAMHHDGMEAEELYENEQALCGAGYVLALTDNVELNQILMQRWAEELDSEKVFGWIPINNSTQEHQLKGQSVFGDLSRPSVIGSELLQRESSFETVIWEEGKSLASGDWHPLFIRRGKSFKAIPRDSSLKDMVKPLDEVICLRRYEGFLMRAMHRGDILEVDCESTQSLYEQLAEIEMEHVPSILEEQVVNELNEQSRLFPAHLGHGIAIAHVYCEDLNHRICFVAHLKNDLFIPGLEDAIDLVFFIISPKGDSDGHLATLAEIAKNCRSPLVREQIKNAKSVDDVVIAISV